MSWYRACTGGAGQLTPAMEVLFDQLAYCRAKLSELESSQ